jgi:hypothetical protein
MKLSPFLTEIKSYFRKKRKDCIYWKNNTVVRIITFFRKQKNKYTNKNYTTNNDDIDPLEEEENLIIFNYN